MKNRVTIRDVAKRAGFSIGTVSRVVHNDPTVTPIIRQAVLAAIAELDYRPSRAAQGLRRGRTRTIGYVISDMSMPSYIAAVPVAQEVAESLGYTLFIADSRLDRTIEQRVIRTLMDLNVDGLLWTPILPTEVNNIEAVKIRPSMVVTNFTEPFPCVAPEITSASLQAVQRLLQFGHTRFGLVSLRGLASRDNTFLRRFRSVLQDGHGSVVSDGRWTFNDRAECLASMTERLTEPDRPTALLVHSPLLPATVLAARNAGLCIPEQISIVSVGDSEFAQCYNPPIDVVSWDYRSLAETSVRLLVDLINGNPPPTQRTVFPSQLIARGSTAPAPSELRSSANVL